jgi:hypothetical protein
MIEMNVETRKTAQGTEYWDTKEKRIRFVPAGQEPDFDVVENPKSMVKEEDPEFKTVNADDMLDNMNTEQLLDYAKVNDIDVPGNMKKEETIRAHIKESLVAEE